MIQHIFCKNKMYTILCDAMPGWLVLLQECKKQYTIKVLIMLHGVAVNYTWNCSKWRPTFKSVSYVQFVVTAKHRSTLVAPVNGWTTLHLPCGCPQFKFPPTLTCPHNVDHHHHHHHFVLPPHVLQTCYNPTQLPATSIRSIFNFSTAKLALCSCHEQIRYFKLLI